MRTFVVELGTGVDLHGQNPTKAAIRAVRDAFAHVSLPGLRQVAGLADPGEMTVDVILGVPPDAGEVDLAPVAEQFPYGKIQITTQTGGLLAPGGGAYRPELGDRVDALLVVNAAIYVRVP
ncbi:MAG: Lin0512 family protein [Chloroflexi bacterium]|nr:Lin0512 family protein [Chloroflexota bacterium]